MKNLEDKILKKVFVYETRKTFLSILMPVIGVILFTAVTVVIGQSVIRMLIEQQTLDLLDIFQEDISIVRQYFFDTLSTFFTELPKAQVFLFVAGCVLLFVIIYMVLRNFVKISNRTKSIVTFWKSKK